MAENVAVAHPIQQMKVKHQSVPMVQTGQDPLEKAAHPEALNLPPKSTITLKVLQRLF